MVFTILFFFPDYSGAQDSLPVTDSATIIKADTTAPSVIGEPVLPPDTAIGTASDIQPSGTATDSIAGITPLQVDTQPALPPPPPPPVELTFVKYKSFQNPDSIFFNILKVTNNTDETVTGEIVFTVPEGWRIFIPPASRVKVAPGKTTALPFRLIIPRNIKGGVGYVISANLTYDGMKKINTACFVSVPKISDWKIVAPQRMYYMTDESEFEKFSIIISNNGNSNETVKLSFTIGKQLEMYQAKEGLFVAMISLPPNTDTVLTYSVRQLPLESTVPGDNDNKSWKDNSVQVKATTIEKDEATTLWFKKLPSIYSHVREHPSPLNLNFAIRNILASSIPSADVSLSGKIIFCRKRTIDYDINQYSLFMRRKENIGEYADRMWVTTRMWARYAAPRWSVTAGDQGVGLFTGGYGRGIGGYYQINRNNILRGGFVYGIIQPNITGALIHELILKNLPIRTIQYGVNYSSDTYNKINFLSFGLSSGVSFLRNHRINGFLGVSSNYHDYDNTTFQTITDDAGKRFTGFAGVMNYNSKIKKLSLNANTNIYTRHYANIFSRRFEISARAHYDLSKRFGFSVQGARTEYQPYYYLQGILMPTPFSLSEIYRGELVTRFNPKLSLFAGPVVQHSRIQTYSASTGQYIPIATLSEYLSGRLHYRFDNGNVLSPFIQTGFTRVLRGDQTLAGDFYPDAGSLKPYFNFTGGINYRQKNFRVIAYYRYGPYNLNWQQEYFYSGVFRRSIQILPYYEVYLIRNLLRLVTYNSYIYEVAGRSTISRLNIGARFEWYLKNDWLLYINNNLYLYSRYNGEGDKNNVRSLGVDFGFKKKFNIQQPCLKYHDLKIVFFEDMNANLIKEENEPGLDNIYVFVKRESDSASSAEFINLEMVSDNFGEVKCFRIPEGNYSLEIKPLRKVGDLYNINGDNQKITLHEPMVYYVPFVIAYKVTGKVELIRDPFSSEGLLTIDNIRVTATDSSGNSYSCLTDRYGNYNLFVPKTGKYNVTVLNPFSDNFILEQAEYLVDFNGFKEFEINFKFIEKKRPVNINGTEKGTGSIFDGRRVNGTGTHQPSAIPAATEPAEIIPPAATTGTQPGSATTVPAAGVQPVTTPPVVPRTLPLNTSPDAINAPQIVAETAPSKVINPAPGIKWEETQYYIVFGSFSNKTNAEKMFSKVIDKERAMIIVDKKGLYKVVKGYRNMDETLADLEKNKSVFPAAWISKRWAP
ncbi:MAG: hypothetical protein HYY40_13690 [Bacteroidetes bacterium]|nr:hypothetical protein [Bacteroidota bacterium]